MYVAGNCNEMLPVYVKGFIQRATQLHLKSEISYWAQKLWNRPGLWLLHIMLHMSVPLNNQRAVCVKLNASIGVNRHRKLLNHLSTRPIKNIFVFFALAAKKELWLWPHAGSIETGNVENLCALGWHSNPLDVLLCQRTWTLLFWALLGF